MHTICTNDREIGRDEMFVFYEIIKTFHLSKVFGYMGKNLRVTFDSFVDSK